MNTAQLKGLRYLAMNLTHGRTIIELVKIDGANWYKVQQDGRIVGFTETYLAAEDLATVGVMQ